MKNTGSTTWGSGYQLAFVSGEQMGAPGAVDVPGTAPNATADISINLTAPTSGGAHIGYWQLRNPQGTYFGPRIWVSITVPDGSSPPVGDIEVQSVEYPSVVTPGQTFRPKVTVKVIQGQLLQSRGDLLRNTDNNLYGAWPHVAVVGTVNPGQTYTFEFYQDNPITAPAGEGTYESKWRVWRNGNWAGPEITIRFDVRNGGGTRPNPPTPASPGDWYVSRDGSTPQLCVSTMSGVQYDFQMNQSSPESGWLSNNCWSPPALGPYTYEWRVKAKDPVSNIESDWSATRHFSIDSQEVTITPLQFSPGSPSNSEAIRVYTCVQGLGGIGLGLKIEANTATDGSASGDWYWIHHLGQFCYTQGDTNTWPTWETLPLADGQHLVRAVGSGPQGQTVETSAVFNLTRRRPSPPELVHPSPDAWLNSLQVTFTWKPAWRANSYRLLVSTNPNPSISPLIDQTFDASVTSYAATFGSAYPDLYWQVIATNELGSSESTRHFGIDLTNPTSAVSALPSVSYETAFPVNWSGGDNRSGVRWFSVQYRDGNRADSIWVDWMTNITSTAAIFIGQPGHTYYFRSRALDVAGNLEDWPGGNSDTFTEVNPAAKPPSPWWNAAYGNKRNVPILNNDSQSLPPSYPMHLHFDNGTPTTSAELYAASQSAIKGDDFRIVYNDMTELPRYIQSFQPDRIDIWFNLQAPIAANPGSDSTHYQLYYGNAVAVNPPGDIKAVLPPGTDANTIGLWYFDDGTGSSFTDASGNGHHGTLFNSAWNMAGKFATSAVFNGTSTYGEIPSSDAFQLPNFTIEGWYRITSNTTQTILRRRMTTDGDEAYRVELNGIKYWGVIRGGVRVESLAEIVLGRWYHMAFTYDGQMLRLYVNGQLQQSASWTQGVDPSMGPVILGRNSANQTYLQGEVQGLRISDVARSSFPYGGFGDILNEPSVAVGAPIAPPVSGSADLALLSLATYPSSDGNTLVQAIVQNTGSLSTGNGFYTDLYVNHVPTGGGDFTGSLQFWVNDPIAAGATITLTTVITDFASLVGSSGLEVAQIGPAGEISGMLYAQADSAGVVTEPDNANNIYSTGTEICVASPDAYEGDDTAATAKPLTVGQSQVHNVSHPNDQDWVAFTAQQGVTYTIRTSNLGGSADTYLYLYSTDGTTLLASNDDYGGSLASQITWTAPAGGTYYLLVKHWNPNSGGCGTSYMLSVTLGNGLNTLFLPLVMQSYSMFFTGFEVEPNNSTAEANGPLASGQGVSGYFNDARDYYYFNSGTGTITVNLTNVTAAGVQLQLFYETSSTVVAYDPTPPFSIQVGNRPAGKYIIIIYTASPNPNTTTTYNLLLTYP